MTQVPPPPKIIGMSRTLEIVCDWGKDAFTIFPVNGQTRIEPLSWAEIVTFAATIITTEIDRQAAQRLAGVPVTPIVDPATVRTILRELVEPTAAEPAEPLTLAPAPRLRFSPPEGSTPEQTLEVLIELLAVSCTPAQHATMTPHIQRWFKPAGEEKNK